MPENVPVNSHFYQIKATDADTGNNARLTYSLAPVDKNKPLNLMPIDIFPNNGILYLKDALDREAVDQYKVLVHVHDHGIPTQYNATALLRVTVGDANDNKPSWKTTSYSFSVSEDAPVGTLLGAVEAFDVDLEKNGTLVYNITDNAEASSIFRINHSTGQIYLRRNLDREVKEHYEIAVEVRDLGTPTALVGDEKAVVSVTVLDVNDNRPSWNYYDQSDQDLFEDEESNQSVVKVALGTSRKSIIASFRAVDPDAGENGTVRYSLTEPSEFFDLDSESGALITKVDIKETFLKRKKVEKISLVAIDGQGKKSKVKVVDVEFVDKRTIQNVNLENVETFDFVIQQESSASDSLLSFGYKVGSISLPASSSSRSRNSKHHLFCGNRLFSNFNRQLKDGIPFFVDSDEDDPKRLNLFLLNSLNETLRYNLLLCVDWSQCSATLLHNHQQSQNLQQQPKQHSNTHIPSCDHYAKINIELTRGSNFLCNPLPLENNDLYEVKIPWISAVDQAASSSSIGKRRINELLYLNQSTCNDEVAYELSSPMMDRNTLSRLFTITSPSSTSPSTLQFRPHEKSLITRYLHQDFVISLTARWKVIDVNERSTELVQSVPVRVKILSSDKAIGNIVFMNEKSLELEEDCCRVGATILQARINVSHDDFRIRYFLASYGEQHLVGSDDQFTLNPDTGLMALKRELDFERKHEHRVNITAVVYDSKLPIMSVSHVVKIR